MKKINKKLLTSVLYIVKIGKLNSSDNYGKTEKVSAIQIGDTD